MEIAIGASIAGRRALVCTKSVGMNVMLDPLMVLNLTPVHGGLVILLGDDPGGYGSQNDQDTRPLAPLLEMPWLEPATPAEGFAMMREAFDRLRAVPDARHRPRDPELHPVRSEPSMSPRGPTAQPDLGLAREPWRFVPVPRNVVAKHRACTIGSRRSPRGPRPRRSTGSSGTGGLGVHRGRVRRTGSCVDVLGDAPPARTSACCKLGVLYPLAERRRRPDS